MSYIEGNIRIHSGDSYQHGPIAYGVSKIFIYIDIFFGFFKDKTTWVNYSIDGSVSGGGSANTYGSCFSYVKNNMMESSKIQQNTVQCNKYSCIVTDLENLLCNDKLFNIVNYMYKCYYESMSHTLNGQEFINKVLDDDEMANAMKQSKESVKKSIKAYRNNNAGNVKNQVLDTIDLLDGLSVSLENSKNFDDRNISHIENNIKNFSEKIITIVEDKENIKKGLGTYYEHDGVLLLLKKVGVKIKDFDSVNSAYSTVPYHLGHRAFLSKAGYLIFGPLKYTKISLINGHSRINKWLSRNFFASSSSQGLFFGGVLIIPFYIFGTLLHFGATLFTIIYCVFFNICQVAASNIFVILDLILCIKSYAVFNFSPQLFDGRGTKVYGVFSFKDTFDAFKNSFKI